MSKLLTNKEIFEKMGLECFFISEDNTVDITDGYKKVTRPLSVFDSSPGDWISEIEEEIKLKWKTDAFRGVKNQSPDAFRKK